MNYKEVIIIGGFDPQNPNVGGVEIYSRHLSEYLAKKNYKITVIGIDSKKGKKNSMKYDRFIPILSKKNSSNYEFLAKLLWRSLFIDISKNAIIHSQRPDFILPFILRKNKKICTIHGNPSKILHSKKGKFTGTVYNLIEGIVFKRINKIITVDSRMKDLIVKKYPNIENKIEVIPIGINLNTFKPFDKSRLRKKYDFSLKDKILLYVGRFEKEKRLDFLIKTVFEIQKDIPNLKLVLVGIGNEKEKLRNLIKRLKMRNVQIIPSIPNSKIPEILNCADAFILTSMSEGFPTVILESLACGIPAVSTDVGDVCKIVIDGKTGYLANEHNIKEKILKLLKKSEISKEDCINIAKKYSWDNIGKKIVELYQ